MSTGTDVAMQAAGITLMRGDPALVADAIDISRRTYGKIRQTCSGLSSTTLSAYRCGRRLAQSDDCRCGDGISSVSVVSNALLLRRWKPATTTERNHEYR